MVLALPDVAGVAGAAAAELAGVAGAGAPAPAVGVAGAGAPAPAVGPGPGPSATVRPGARLPGSVRPVSLAEERLLPVLPALAGLLPGGGLRRGSTVAVAGSTSLALALIAGASAAGSWCAAVGLPSLGVVAAAEAGVAVSRLALVASPGNDWAAVVAALLDALDVVMVRPPHRQVRAADARRLVARARERGSVLVPLGRWDGADVRLSVAGAVWQGLGEGSGHLRARLVEVVAEGRGAAARPRRARLWLPAAGGGVAPAAAPTSELPTDEGPGAEGPGRRVAATPRDSRGSRARNPDPAAAEAAPLPPSGPYLVPAGE